MGEEKFASLSSGLLARKGAAKPAMRRQGFINPQGDVTEDLGWNDMGFDPPRPIDTDSEYQGEAPLPEVRRQQDQLAEGLNEEEAPHTDFDASAENVDAEFYEEVEPYKANGHGGLSPMGADDIEDEESVEDEFDEREVDQAFDAVAEDQETSEFDAETVIDAEAEADDLGWAEGSEPVVHDTGVRDHGESPLSLKKGGHVEPAPTPVSPPADKVEPEIESVPAREKVAFTLRLDKDRHLKLRLASAVLDQSAQRLVTEALDRFLDEHPDVQALTGQMSSAKKH